MRSLPNLISALRLLLSPLVLFFSQKGDHEEAAALFLLLALSDAVDGFIARRFNAQTHLGKLLDPLADKVLLLTGLFCVSFFTPFRLDPALIILLFSRDVFLVVGSLVLRRSGFVPEPSPSGKLTTFCVSLTVILAFSVNLLALDSLKVLLKGLEITSIALILISWTDYTLRGVSFLRGKLIIERR